MRSPSPTTRLCVSGALGIALLGGLATVPATGATAAPVDVASSAARAVDTTTITSALTGWEPGVAKTLAGTARPNATIEFHALPAPGDRSAARGATDVRTTADAAGRWSLTTPPSTSRAGVVSASLPTGGTDGGLQFTFFEDGTPVQDGVRFTTQSPTTYERGRVLVVSGTAPAGHEVRALEGGGTHAGTIADAAGRWTLEFDQRATGKGSFTADFHVNGTRHSVRFTAAPAAVAPITVATSEFVQGRQQLVEGTAQPGARIDVHRGPKYLRTVTADATGAWSFTTAVITADTFTRTLKSAGTADVTVTLTAKPTSATRITLTSDPTYTRGEAMTMSGTANRPYGQLYAKSGTTLLSIPIAGDGSWTWTIPAGAAALQDDSFSFRFFVGDGALDQTFTARH